MIKILKIRLLIICGNIEYWYECSDYRIIIVLYTLLSKQCNKSRLHFYFLHTLLTDFVELVIFRNFFFSIYYQFIISVMQIVQYLWYTSNIHFTETGPF